MDILHFIRAGGLVMWPLLALSLVAGAIVVERALVFRQIGSVSQGLISRAISLCEQKKYDEALRQCRAQPGVMAACLAVVLEHRGEPMARIERRVEEVGQEGFLELEKRLSFLDTTTTISPLLGLLGTIFGMIGVFNALGTQRTQGNNDAVLNGVAEALYATATGIVIAVVCFVAYNHFASRLRTVSARTEIAVTKLLNVLEENADESSTRSAQNEVSRAV